MCTLSVGFSRIFYAQRWECAAPGADRGAHCAQLRFSLSSLVPFLMCSCAGISASKVDKLFVAMEFAGSIAEAVLDAVKR